MDVIILFKITNLKQDRYGPVMGKCHESVVKHYKDSNSVYLRFN